MITKLELIEYLKHTPENTNYNILRSGLYNGSNKEAVDEFIEVLSRGNLSLAALQPYLAKLYEDDKTISPEPLPPFSSGGSVPKPLTYDYMPEGYPSKVNGIPLLKEQVVAFALISDIYAANIPNPSEIVEGQTYTVNWDGTEYECVCGIFNSNPTIGNLSIAGGGDDTGEPFLYMYTASEQVGQFGTLDTSASHTIAIKKQGEGIIPMAYYYMPEGYPKKTMGTATVMEEQEFSFESDESGRYMAVIPSTFEIVLGNTYIVKWDGTEYECVSFPIDQNEYAFGNLSIFGVGTDTGVPFIYVPTYGGIFTLDTSVTHTVGVKTTAETAIPMSAEFIPKMNVSAFTNDAGYLTSHQDISGKQDKLIAGDNITISADGRTISATGGGGGVQPDWNQNDDTQPDYVKNRPFYTGDPVETVIIPTTTVAFSENSGLMAAAWPENFDLVGGKTYTISWDGTDYVCTGTLFNNIPVLGNLILLGAGENTGEPFLFVNQAQWTVASTESATEHIIGIKVSDIPIVTLNENYLPKASADDYGVVKKSEIVTSYKFDAQAPHDQMVEAIAAFGTGNASIVWAEKKVINASYNSSDDTISVTFAEEPLKTLTFPNNNGAYVKNLRSATYGELQGNQVRIFNDNNAYAVLAAEGEFPNVTLGIDANRISINGIYGMSTTEMILKSSTSGSTKVFKITVDDTGTLSATEVT